MIHEIVLEGNAFINGSFQHCCIGIDDGKISAIKKILTGDKRYRFSKQILVPPGVDVHVHFRDPGMRHKETFQTGTTAAACGGISCVFDMPNTLPQTTTVSTLKEKITYASQHSLVDFGVHAGITNENIQHITELALVANGFKMYLGSTTNALLLSTANLPSVFQQLEKTRTPVLCHAEDRDCLKRHFFKEKNLKDHHSSRPPLCETKAIQEVLKNVANYDVSLHLCHVSSKESVELLKNRSPKVTCGVTPHHSLLDLEHLQLNDAMYKVNPPIRPKEHRDVLFEALCTGSVDLLESDHAPHLLEEKRRDFSEAPAGLPGVETMMPLFFSLAVKEKLTFPRFFEVLCEKPAKLMGIPKGVLKVGYDGDVAVFDIRNVTKISADRLHSKAEWTPFEGWPAIFPLSVFIRGEQVVEDGECVGKPGFGRHVTKRVDND